MPYTVYIIKTLHFDCVCLLPLTNCIFVSQWVHTKLAVAVILSLLLLLPAFAHAESIMCEVGLCREEDKQRPGRRYEKKRKCLSCPKQSQTLILVSLEKDKVVITKPRFRIPLYGTGGGGGMCDGITSVLHFPS